MRAAITEKIGGKAVTFALPLGGLEEIAEVNPQLGEVRLALEHGIWRIDELGAVIRAGLKHGEAQGLDVEAVYEALGVDGTVALARRLLDKAWGDDPPKKAPAAGKSTVPKRAS